MNLTKNSLVLAVSCALMFGFTIFSPGFVNAVPPKVSLVPSDYETGIDWTAATKLDKPVAVNFYVDWCGYCRRFAPVFESLRKEYKDDYSFVIVKADTPENKKLAEEFGIKSYPSFYLTNSKGEKRSLVNQGYYTDMKSLKKELDKFLKDNK